MLPKLTSRNKYPKYCSKPNLQNARLTDVYDSMENPIKFLNSWYEVDQNQWTSPYQKIKDQQRARNCAQAVRAFLSGWDFYIVL